MSTDANGNSHCDWCNKAVSGAVMDTVIVQTMDATKTFVQTLHACTDQQQGDGTWTTGCEHQTVTDPVRLSLNPALPPSP